MNHETSKRTIESLLSNHENLNDEIIMLIVKNLTNQNRIFENDIYSMFIFEILQTGTNDTILSILNLLPKHHNFEIFQLLTEFYHDPDYTLLKENIALAQLHILISFPYYLSASFLDEDINYLIKMINPYKANYQLILHLIRLDMLTDTDIIHNYIQNNKQALSIKLNFIINKGQLTIEDINMVLDYLFSEALDIQKENFHYIIEFHYDSFDSSKKVTFLSHLLKHHSNEFYSFIVDNYYLLGATNTTLKKEFNHYLRNVL